MRVFSKRSSRCQRTVMAVSNGKKQTESVYSLDSAISGEKDKRGEPENRMGIRFPALHRREARNNKSRSESPVCVSPLAARLKRIETVQRSRKSCSGERLSQTASFPPSSLPSFAHLKRAVIAAPVAYQQPFTPRGVNRIASNVDTNVDV